MATNDYHFVTRWRVLATPAAVYDLLVDAQSYLRWWPQVYLEVTTITPPGEHGLGAVNDLHTRGKLPYTLRWRARVTETRYPAGFTIEATGDFLGRGIWSFEKDGDGVNVIFDWRLRAEKPLLRYLSFLFKPLFRANHRWAMARGREGLQKELDARAAL
ncbi:MAG: SRPBCC family protein [Verrucomicrobia bacterium]|nr:SRPBCC family protein [Verrucomicrobiota bacterium]